MNLKRGALFLTVIIIVLGGVYAAWNTGYRVNNGASQDVIVGSAGGDCHKVTNNNGNDIFVPTKTTSEWNSFDSNKPSGVSTGSCTVCRSASSSNGMSYTWYYSPYNTCGFTATWDSSVVCGINIDSYTFPSQYVCCNDGTYEYCTQNQISQCVSGSTNIVAICRETL